LEKEVPDLEHWMQMEKGLKVSPISNR